MGLDDLFFTTEERVSRDLDEVLTVYHRNRPRNLQVELGPSEIGHACARKLGFALMREPECNPEFDPLPSFVGTEAHSGFADAATAMNERLGRTRYLVEHRVEVRRGTGGSCDLIDLDYWTVIDHKFLTAERIKKYMSHPPESLPLHYRRQAHLYGFGARRAGFPIENVMLHFLPRGGLLSAKRTFFESYSQEIAEETMARYDGIMVSLDVFDVENHPENYRMFPAAASDDCVYCPWYRAKPQTVYECNGTVLGEQIPIQEAS
ncbi:hypothetical protein [Gordonia sp. N1V]|uniref:hypothetical protein n=1 Tax=Gordonia sp. N1V TaxID=3034163 RepID=UPI0023E1E072|nr:hypothetical protein [Gordonia sp. N1V]MDF3280859.1 hypothetical protein [Gordonia sp. N1V]